MTAIRGDELSGQARSGGRSTSRQVSPDIAPGRPEGGNGPAVEGTLSGTNPLYGSHHPVDCAMLRCSNPVTRLK